MIIFKKIPFFSDYEINRFGIVQNYKTKKIINYRVIKKKSGDNVKSVNLTMDNGCRTTRTIKGLLCLTWKN